MNVLRPGTRVHFRDIQIKGIVTEVHIMSDDYVSYNVVCWGQDGNRFLYTVESCEIEPLEGQKPMRIGFLT